MYSREVKRRGGYADFCQITLHTFIMYAIIILRMLERLLKCMYVIYQRYYARGN